MGNFKTSKSTDTKLTSISKALEKRTRVLLIEQMVHYFYVTNLDPLDTSNNELKGMIQNLENVFKGWTANSEREIHKPNKILLEKNTNMLQKLAGVVNPDDLYDKIEKGKYDKIVKDYYEIKKELEGVSRRLLNEPHMPKALIDYILYNK